MKLKCITEKLIKAVSKAEKMIGKNLNLPILSCILLEVKENKLFLKDQDCGRRLRYSPSG